MKIPSWKNKITTTKNNPDNAKSRVSGDHTHGLQVNKTELRIAMARPVALCKSFVNFSNILAKKRQASYAECRTKVIQFSSKFRLWVSRPRRAASSFANTTDQSPKAGLLEQTTFLFQTELDLLLIPVLEKEAYVNKRLFVDICGTKIRINYASADAYLPIDAENFKSLEQVAMFADVRVGERSSLPYRQCQLCILK